MWIDENLKSVVNVSLLQRSRMFWKTGGRENGSNSNQYREKRKVGGIFFYLTGVKKNYR